MDRHLSLSEQPKLNKLIIRFSSGAAAGLVIAVLYWCSTIYFAHSIMLRSGVLGSLATSIICGLLAIKFGSNFWKAVEELLPLL